MNNLIQWTNAFQIHFEVLHLQFEWKDRECNSDGLDNAAHLLCLEIHSILSFFFRVINDASEFIQMIHLGLKTINILLDYIKALLKFCKVVHGTSTCWWLPRSSDRDFLESIRKSAIKWKPSTFSYFNLMIERLYFDLVCSYIRVGRLWIATKTIFLSTIWIFRDPEKSGRLELGIQLSNSLKIWRHKK